MKPLEQKSCSSCQTTFTCGPKPGEESCWCDQLPRVGPVAGAEQDCLCPECLPEAMQRLARAEASPAACSEPKEKDAVSPYTLIAGEDYYSEGAAIVFTARYHLRRGYCCDNKCRHCPY